MHNQYTSQDAFLRRACVDVATAELCPRRVYTDMFNIF